MASSTGAQSPEVAFTTDEAMKRKRSELEICELIEQMADLSKLKYQQRWDLNSSKSTGTPLLPRM